jgi:hypothetical protein
VKFALRGGAGFQPAISGVAPEIVRRTFRLEPGKVRMVSVRAESGATPNKKLATFIAGRLGWV